MNRKLRVGDVVRGLWWIKGGVIGRVTEVYSHAGFLTVMWLTSYSGEETIEHHEGLVVLDLSPLEIEILRD
jgi:hypothetical protein